MHIFLLSIEAFKTGRIKQTQKHENRKTVLFWINEIKAKKTIPPVEVSYFYGEKDLTIIDGNHRLKAHIVTGTGKIIFKRTFTTGHYSCSGTGLFAGIC